MKSSAHAIRCLTLVLALGTLAFQVAAGEAPDQPAPKQSKGAPDAGFIKRHEGFVAEAKKGGIDVLFMGDSITDGWRGGGKKVYAEHFVPLKTANFGIGGDRTQHVLWRLQNGELEGYTPKVMMLMIGTNNSGGDSVEAIAKGVTAIVNYTKQKSPTTKILLLAIFPRGEKPAPIREKLKSINEIIAKLDDGGKTVKYLDIGAKFMEADGTISKEIMPDFLHLSEKGYTIWAEAVKGPITELMK
jgi:lysophospholipase L1-like esterase